MGALVMAVSASLGACAEGGARVVAESTIRVDVGAPGRGFDRRVLGTNAPAWLGPERLADPAFRDAVLDLGTTVVRMPGGSWSNSYDWLACERRDAGSCAWPWAARPSDYASFLAATGLAGMWTASINGTAQEAAALVAFFNGDVDDERVIGVDARHRDWGTVGGWARLRAAGGHPHPVRVGLWEVGNEVYGAEAAAGPDCASFGWEHVWTCEGNAYVRGDRDHDGFTEFRDAMRAVDPSIAVGAVGIGGSQHAWGGFGQEVIDAAGTGMDFYVVHHYGFEAGEPSTSEILGEPARSWGNLVAGVEEGFAAAGHPPAPVAVTEYNLFARQEGDTAGLMAAPVSALHAALTIGELVDAGVGIANHWNLVNGRTEHGSDYGIFDAADGAPNPQFYGLAAWSRMRDVLVPVSAGGAAHRHLEVHASTDPEGGLTVLVVNRSDEPVDAVIEVPHVGDGAVLDVAVARVEPSARGAATLVVDGSWDRDAEVGVTATGPFSSGRTSHRFQPTSITVLSTG